MENSSTPSFLTELSLGRLRWDLIHPFPGYAGPEREAADVAVAELAEYLRNHVDPEAIDRTQTLPDAVLKELRERGFLAVAAAPEQGGRELSAFAVFRIVHTAASWSMPVAQVMAVQAAIGVNALLPAVGAGPLRDHLVDRVGAGVLSGSADSEPDGAANHARATCAVPTPDGAGFVLTGEKVYVGNGPLAQTVIVSATVPPCGDAPGSRRLFVVDTDSPGVVVRARHELMGLRGFPIAAIGLEGVRVPRERMLVEPEDAGLRLTPELVKLVVTGRMFLIAAPSLALARRAMQWMREFADRRLIDGRPLAGYEYVRHDIATSAADTFLIDTVVRWCLLAGPVVDPLPERMAAKNIAAVTCWRVLDRAMSLLAAEGYETAASKAARGVPPLPLERAYRDARALRISGGVDQLLDFWASLIFTMPRHLSEADAESEAGAALVDPDVSWCAETPLSPRNQGHLAEIIRQVHVFGATARELAQNRSREQLAAEQRKLVLLNRILNELMTSALVLARAASATGDGDPDDAQFLADVACTAAGTRLADHWRQFAEEVPAGHVEVTDRWMSGVGLEPLAEDLV